MNYYILKLTSGDVIYGMIDEDTISENFLVVSHPMMWEEFYDDEGHASNSLVKYISGTDEEDIPVQSSNIISMALMSKEFIEFYDAALMLQSLSSAPYKKKLLETASRMRAAYNKHTASQIQKATGDIVAYYAAESDSGTIH